ncbi:MAG: hypothetical protein M3R27_00335 [Bacteroidota bacterium]|nr:hypothetical protein [Bacteroidota bacterium]
MKTFFYLALFSICLISCKPSRDEALVYNDKIVAFQKAIDNKEVALLEAFKTREPEIIDKAYTDFKSQITISAKELETLGTFDEQAYFIEGARSLFSTYKAVAEKEYNTLVDINKMNDSLYTEDVQAMDDENTKAINSKLDSGLAEFTAIQEKFAAEYDFIFEKTGEKQAEFE